MSVAQATHSFYWYIHVHVSVSVCVRVQMLSLLAIFCLKQKPLAHRKVKMKRNTGGSVIKTLWEPSTDVRSLLLQQEEQAKASEKTASGQPSTGQPILCDRCSQWFNGPTPWEDHKLGFKHHKNSNWGVTEVSCHHKEKRRRHCHSQVYSICHLSVCLVR